MRISACAPRLAAGCLEQPLGAIYRGTDRNRQHHKDPREPADGLKLRVMVATLPRTGDGALEYLLVGGPFAAKEMEPTSQNPRLSQARKLAF
jgi:hypothetical protein